MDTQTLKKRTADIIDFGDNKLDLFFLTRHKIRKDDFHIVNLEEEVK